MALRRPATSGLVRVRESVPMGEWLYRLPPKKARTRACDFAANFPIVEQLDSTASRSLLDSAGLILGSQKPRQMGSRPIDRTSYSTSYGGKRAPIAVLCLRLASRARAAALDEKAVLAKKVALRLVKRKRLRAEEIISSAPKSHRGPDQSRRKRICLGGALCESRGPGDFRRFREPRTRAPIPKKLRAVAVHRRKKREGGARGSR